MNENIAYTENKAKAYNTTNSSILDLFSCSGTLRSANENEIKKKLDNALREDELLTLKLVFYTRDIKEGLGERRVFRIMINHIASNNPNLIIQNLSLIPKFGRFDDLLELLDTPCEEDTLLFIKNQLTDDLERLENNDGVSLLGKWLPSINTSSEKTRERAHKIARSLNVSNEKYRKTLSKLRKKINIVETNISRVAYSEINYEKVPSKAIMKYRRAFFRNDEERFVKYIEDVKTGTKKINAGTVYPYEIFNKLSIKHSYNGGYSFENRDPVLIEQWKNLTNYVDKNSNVLICADTSSSMTIGVGTNPKPIDVSLSLAFYFAERNTGIFSNAFLTFDTIPRLVRIEGESLYEKVEKIEDLYGSTNLEAVFDLLLNIAVENDVSENDLPKSLIIISDMQFNRATYRSDINFLDAMREKYTNFGYSLPNIIFWNVSGKNSVVHALRNDYRIQLVSGVSPTVFKSVLSIINKTPFEAMLEILKSERYDVVTN